MAHYITNPRLMFQGKWGQLISRLRYKTRVMVGCHMTAGFRSFSLFFLLSSYFPLWEKLVIMTGVPKLGSRKAPTYSPICTCHWNITFIPKCYRKLHLTPVADIHFHLASSTNIYPLNAYHHNTNSILPSKHTKLKLNRSRVPPRTSARFSVRRPGQSSMPRVTAVSV